MTRKQELIQLFWNKKGVTMSLSQKKEKMESMSWSD